jgi:4a-hydroxytetrahydrobiopterin dehydratase
MGRQRLDEQELRGALEDLEGWSVAGDAITATYAFDNYESGVAFAMRVALYAQRVDHHPDLLIQWGKVTVTWSTHDAGGVTQRDIKGAAYVSDVMRAQSSQAR